MKIIAYIRVSSVNKADHEPSATEQERKIRAWARSNGHQVVAVYSDTGVSGAEDLTGRMGMAEALAVMKGRGLAVSRLDRLARDMMVQEQLMAEIKARGGVPFTCADGEQTAMSDDPDDPSRKLIRHVLGAVIEYEREMTVLRLRRGKRATIARGGYAGGFVPLGVRVEDGQFVEDISESVAIERIAELREQGRSLRETVTILQAEGYQTKRGGKWHPSTVQRVLARQDATS